MSYQLQKERSLCETNESENFAQKEVFKKDNGYIYALKAYYDQNSSNDQEAISLLQRAVEENNNSDAAFLLGVAYGEGNCVSKDSVKSFKWYEKAALLGDKDSMLLIGWLYYKGEGVKKDLEKAKEWFKKAGDLGDMEASKMADFIDEMMQPLF